MLPHGETPVRRLQRATGPTPMSSVRVVFRPLRCSPQRRKYYSVISSPDARRIFLWAMSCCATIRRSVRYRARINIDSVTHK